MLLLADLHFTDKVQDDYRWNVFDFVLEYYEKTQDKNLLILGDLTDSKDHHSSVLVNRIVKYMRELVSRGMDITILKGNHDYIDPDQPFFQFLEEIDYVGYVKDPSAMLIEGIPCLLLPHTRDPIEEWESSPIVKQWCKKAKLVFMHQSVIGSVASNGFEMAKGLPRNYLTKFPGKVISGDIHCPQKVGKVEYVGSPYSIRFDDHFFGQAMSVQLMDSGGLKVRRWDTKLQCRRTIRIFGLDELEGRARPGDQVKVVLTITDNEYTRQDVLEACQKHGYDLRQLVVTKEQPLPLRGKRKRVEQIARDPRDVVETFGKRRGLKKADITTGRKIIDEAT